MSLHDFRFAPILGSLYGYSVSMYDAMKGIIWGKGLGLGYAGL